MKTNNDDFEIIFWGSTFRHLEVEAAFRKNDLPAVKRSIIIAITVLVTVLLVTFLLDYRTLSDVATSAMYRTLTIRLAGAMLCVAVVFLVNKCDNLFKLFWIIVFVVATATGACFCVTISYIPYIDYSDSPLWYSALLLFTVASFPVPLKFSIFLGFIPITGTLGYLTLVHGTPLYNPVRFGSLMVAFLAIGIAISIRENLTRRKEYKLLKEQQSANERLTIEVKERKRVEELLNMRKDQLETRLAQTQRLESIAMLAGGIAHDFNNLLLPIMGFSDLAQRKLPKDSPALPFLKQINQAAKSAKKLTSQLLAFGRKQLLEVKQIDLNQLIRDLDEMIKSLLRENIELKVELGPSLKHVLADPSQIEQIIMNLVINARDAMPNRGTMVISTSNTNIMEMKGSSLITMSNGIRSSSPGLKDEYVRIDISDTGIGIDPQNISRIFDPFFTTKAKGEGTGLGLAMVHGIVFQHGGQISVDSKLGVGSKIQIFLPVAAQDVSKGSEEPQPVARMEGNETILLAEDDNLAREYMREVLENLGYNVLIASNGEEALRIAAKRKGTIHLLITDVAMPKMNGAELWEKIRNMLPEMRGLFVSGYANEDLGHYGVLDDGIEFLRKPFEARTLAAKIRQILAG